MANQSIRRQYRTIVVPNNITAEYQKNGCESSILLLFYFANDADKTERTEIKFFFIYFAE